MATNPPLDYGDIVVTLTLENNNTDPETPGLGEMYFNTGAERPMVYAGGEGFVPMPIFGDTISVFGGPTDTYDFNGQMLTNIAQAEVLDQTSATSVKSVQNLIALTCNYGGYSMTASGAPQAITGGTYVELQTDATFTQTESNNFTLTNNQLTFTGDFPQRFLVISTASISSTDSAVMAYLDVYVDGASTGYPPFAVALQAVDKPTLITWQRTVVMTPGQTIAAYATFALDDTINVASMDMTVTAVQGF